MRTKILALVMGGVLSLTVGQQATAAITAIDATGMAWGTAGSTSFGWEFTTDSTIFVTELGYFDGPNYDHINNITGTFGDGLQYSHDVAIWDVNGDHNTPLATATIDDSHDYDNFFRYADIAPVVLVAGTYRIAGFNVTPVGGLNDSFGGNATGVTYGSAVTFDGYKYNGDASLEYPEDESGGSGDGVSYFGGNFKYTTEATVPEPSSIITLAGLLATFGLFGWWKKRKQAA